MGEKGGVPHNQREEGAQVGWWSRDEVIGRLRLDIAERLRLRFPGDQPLHARTDIQLVLRCALYSRCPLKCCCDTRISGLSSFHVCGCSEELETEDGTTGEPG